MPWIVLAIISITSVSVANVYQRMAMREEGSDPIAGAIVFQFVLVLITGIFAIFKGFVIPPISQYPLQFLISSVFYALGTLVYFYAAQKVEASEMRVLSAIGTLVPIFGGVFFLGEHVVFKQIIGMLLIVLAVFLVQKKKTISFQSGTLYAILGSCFYGIALTSDTFILRTYDAVSYMVVISLLPGLLLLVLRPRMIVRLPTFINPSMKHVFLYGFFYSIQAVTYYMALQNGANLSQMAPLFKAEVVLTVLLAALMLKERKNLPLYLASAGIVMIGALLIA